MQAMTDWDFIVASGQLKKKQEEMLKYYTDTIDALKILKQDAAFLEGVWQGEAREVFFSAFYTEWSKLHKQVIEMGCLIYLLLPAEEVFDCCEKEIQNKIG